MKLTSVRTAKQTYLWDGAIWFANHKVYLSVLIHIFTLVTEILTEFQVLGPTDYMTTKESTFTQK